MHTELARAPPAAASPASAFSCPWLTVRPHAPARRARSTSCCWPSSCAGASCTRGCRRPSATAAAAASSASDGDHRLLKAAALAHLDGLAGQDGGGGGVVLRHKSLLADILTRKARGVPAVAPLEPTPEGHLRFLQ